MKLISLPPPSLLPPKSLPPSATYVDSANEIAATCALRMRITPQFHQFSCVLLQLSLLGAVALLHKAILSHGALPQIIHAHIIYKMILSYLAPDKH